MSRETTGTYLPGEFRSGHGEGDDWEGVTEACFDRLQLPRTRANLGFMYLTDALADDAGRILDRLCERTGVRHWVGSTGLGVCGTGREYFDHPAMSVLVGAFPDGSFRVFDGLVADLETFGGRYRSWCEIHQSRIAVVHGDPRNAAIGGLVADLAAWMGEGFLVGGLSSSRHDYVQIADGLTRGGLSGVLFGADVTFVTRLTQGCSPIGARHSITRCRDNVLIELDGRPAVEVLLDDLGRPDAKAWGPMLNGLHVALPVTGTDTGDYLVRNLLGIDPRAGVLAVGEHCERGQQILFCRRDADAARTDLVRMLGELRRALGRPPRAGLYHTCLARGPNLFGPGSRELALIERELGAFPLAGFFGNGEISHDRVYGYTGVLTLFS